MRGPAITSGHFVNDVYYDILAAGKLTCDVEFSFNFLADVEDTSARDGVVDLVVRDLIRKQSSDVFYLLPPQPH